MKKHEFLTLSKEAYRRVCPHLQKEVVLQILVEVALLEVKALLVE